MYTYVRMLGGTVSTLGICVSLYSVGRLATSVPFGTWADKRSSSREVLIWSSILAVVGNSLYAFAPWALKGFLPGGVVLGVLCASRFAVGCGTGSLSVCKAYLAANSKVEERTKVIAWSGMAQYAGFSITPIVATFLMWLENAYTPSDPSGEDGSPTFLACILPGVALAIANALLVPFLYYSMPARDPCTIPSPKSTPERTSVVSYGSTTTLVNEDGESSPEASPSPPPVALPPPSLPTPATTTRTKSRKEREEDLIVRWGFILFFFLNFVLRGIIGVTETIAPDMYEHLRSDHENYLEESGRFFFYLGLAGLAVFLLIDPIQKRLIKGDYLLCLGTLAVALGTVLNFDPSPAVTPSSYRRFVAGMVFTWSVGSPICQTLTVSMFSTMLGRRPQGGMIGWITTAGSLGRIAFPALVGVGMRVVNGVDVGMCLVCCVGVLGYRRWVKRVRERELEEERRGLLH
ncbi:hypothetical protein HDV00_002189 [Rhizophlyctis rosea]|nr:hypothetical protein HDV00_002189 [Rhizophlyctis rosea]